MTEIKFLRFGMVLLAWGICTIIAARPVLAAEDWQSIVGSGPVSLEADQFTSDQENKTFQADGNVRLQQGQLVLTSDRLQWDADSQEARAQGHVQLVQGQDRLTADSARLNLKTGLGDLSQAELFMRKSNLHLAGGEVEKLGADSYHVQTGTFTTCDGDPPAWKFTARDIDIQAGRSASARHAVFYLHNIPVLYSPFLYFPLLSDRESGFLLPRYGYSKKRGPELSLAYYLVIARNQDATFLVDFLGDLGLGKGLQYRYIFEESREGRLHLYHINGFNNEPNQYSLSWRHHGQLPGGVLLAADTEYVSRKSYFADLGENADEYTRTTTQSVIYLARSWDKVYAGGQVKYLQDLEQSNDLTLQRLPEVRLSLLRRRLGETPFFFLCDLDSTYFWRQEGEKGERLDISPALAAVWNPGGWLGVTATAGYRLQWYKVSDDDRAFGFPEASLRISTRMQRVFQVGGKHISKLLHSIEPEVLYGYVANGDQDDRPQFGDEDFTAPRHQIIGSLTNRLIARIESAQGEVRYHEYLFFRLTQEYNPEDSPADPLNPQDLQKSFSDMRAELIVRPTRLSFVDLDARYDFHSPEPGTHRLMVFNARGGFREGGGNGFSAEYQYRGDGPEYVGVDLDLALLKPIYLNYQQRYALDGHKNLESVLGIEYRAQCWSLHLSYRDRPGEQEYLLTFALAGVGKVLDLGTRVKSQE